MSICIIFLFLLGYFHFSVVTDPALQPRKIIKSDLFKNSLVNKDPPLLPTTPRLFG